MRDTEFSQIGLMEYAYIPMFREPEAATILIQQWDDGKKKSPNGIPSYLAFVHLICAQCVRSVILQDHGKINEAWAMAMDAQIHSGVALSMYVSKHDVKHAERQKGSNAGKNKKSEITKSFAEALCQKTGYPENDDAFEKMFAIVTNQSLRDGWRMSTSGSGRATLRRWIKRFKSPASTG
jgi:hypothetical protein